MRRLPVTGALWVAGLFAVMGSPPFGAFSSELTILRAAIGSGSWVVAALYSLFITAVFAGIISVLVRMAQGAPRGMRPVSASAAHGGTAHRASAAPQESALAVGAPLVLLAATMAFGIYIPGFLDAALRQAAALLGG